MPDSGFAPLSLTSSMQRMAAAVQSVVPPADNSKVEQALGNEGLAAVSNQVNLAQGDSLLERIVRTLVEARMDTHFYTGMCPRNFSVTCPSGYSEDTSLGLCVVGEIADESLPAECASFPIAGDRLRAAEFSKKCKTQWPCAACTKSFKTCPEKFEPQQQDVPGVCAPTREYLGPCKEIVDFRKFKDVQTKARWATSCYTDWPCDPE